uniref:Transposon Ty3-I Gag-Pol polyprotein n=1 Tax=Cajanus cajan TaxID=3821 RepID=A0A151R2L8_CAJCA|nr:Transposon Ty3-I Gag-Pol polyprotein [Cajanus cajan]
MAMPPIQPPKLQLTTFEGADPLDWLFQAEKFFLLYQIAMEHRLHMAAFYMKGEALSWFKWMYHNHRLTDWHSFARALELRFGPSSYTNHQQELYKLRQFGTVSEYQAQFERLSNRVYGLSPENLLNCFISGLRSDLRHELLILHPPTISEAIGLAKLFEAKFRDSKPKTSKPYLTTPSTNSPTHITPPTSISPTPVVPPIKRLTSAQMQERRALGLCYNCDDKFIPGHKCSTPRFLLLIEDDPDLTTTTPSPTDPTSSPLFHLSFQALTGHPSPQSFQFRGSIHHLNVRVLIDTGSSHNILQPRLASHLQLPITPIPHFSVMVGNGQHIACTGLCEQVPIILHGHSFSVPFYLMSIEGADAVLGIDWLRTLGPLTADFSTLSLSFTHNDVPITIKVDPTHTPTLATFHHFNLLKHHNAIASCHLIFTHRLDNNTHNPELHLPPTLNPEIKTLISNHTSIFTKPTGLPPIRTHDHHIPLLPNTPPINVKPYRYPHTQKDAMSHIIQDLLTQGLITPSHSPFSSPVLLVHKKDGTWRLCVDYRALNSVTIKDRFPIPTVDELLDELGKATIFSKLDLRSGYHQIRMAPEDTYKTAFRTCDGHYERFIRQYATLAAPLTDLLAPQKFTWTQPTASEAFTCLKNKLSTSPILHLPNFDALFVVETDASGVAIGFDIFYKPGRLNIVADALSRQFGDTQPFMSCISSPVPVLLGQLQQYFQNEPEGIAFIQQVQTSQELRNKFHIANGLIYYGARLFIPAISELRQSLIAEFHASPTAGHSGLKPTVARLAASFYWPGLYTDTKLFIKQCTICQQNKYMPKRKPGLLQPLPIPLQVWDDLTMDFITHLPQSHGHTVIWVICDRLSKSVHFIGLPTHFSAKDLARRFSVEVCRLHGIPRSITTDRDPLFLSHF